nr:hypothetical protein [Candidatus Sigynarchaeota archaeon]
MKYNYSRQMNPPGLMVPTIISDISRKNTEIELILDEIDINYDDEQVDAGLEELDRHIKNETETWKSSFIGMDAIKNVLKVGKKDKHEKA